MTRLADTFDAEGVTPRGVGRLLVADVATILVLIVLGEIRHGVDVVADPGRVVVTAAPFLAGWLLVGGLVGAYGPRAFGGTSQALRITVGAWLGGAGLGLTLRGTEHLPGNAPLPFALVMFGLGALALGLVRVVSLRYR